MPTKKPRKNGLVLTAKNLPTASYNAIHKLPYGYRQGTMHALLEAAAVLASKRPDWYKAAINGELRVITARKR